MRLKGNVHSVLPIETQCNAMLKETQGAERRMQCVSTTGIARGKFIMTLYKNKYRIESTRLKGWDYSRDGYYFVTICTQDKKYFFGDIVDEKVRLSAIGEMVADEWQKTAQIRKNVSLDTWIIMPNHVHGIVVINNDESPVETHCMRLMELYTVLLHREETHREETHAMRLYRRGIINLVCRQTICHL